MIGKAAAYNSSRADVLLHGADRGYIFGATCGAEPADRWWLEMLALYSSGNLRQAGG